MKLRPTSLALGLLAAAYAGDAAADAPKVVVSIKPLHSLVAGVMQGIGIPRLLIDGAASPHSFTLRPDAAQALQSADAVFWIGPGLETFLSKPVKALTGKAAVALAEVEGMDVLDSREGGIWTAHDHGDEHGEDEHGHDEHAHDEHAHDERGHEERGHEERGQGEHGHDEHDQEMAEKDLHIWLDPVRAQRMVVAIAAAMKRTDPDNAGRYARNAESVIARLDALRHEVEVALRPVKDVPYIVFHDAYRYFEDRFGLNAVGSISLGPELGTGAKRLREVQDTIGRRGARCVFAEPQFDPKLVRTVVEGTAAKTATLDPLGATVPAGPDAYAQLLTGLAQSLKTCLGEAG